MYIFDLIEYFETRLTRTVCMIRASEIHYSAASARRTHTYTHTLASPTNGKFVAVVVVFAQERIANGPNDTATMCSFSFFLFVSRCAYFFILFRCLFFRWRLRNRLHRFCRRMKWSRLVDFRVPKKQLADDIYITTFANKRAHRTHTHTCYTHSIKLSCTNNKTFFLLLLTLSLCIGAGCSYRRTKFRFESDVFVYNVYAYRVWLSQPYMYSTSFAHTFSAAVVRTIRMRWERMDGWRWSHTEQRQQQQRVTTNRAYYTILISLRSSVGNWRCSLRARTFPKPFRLVSIRRRTQ